MNAVIWAAGVALALFVAVHALIGAGLFGWAMVRGMPAGEFIRRWRLARAVVLDGSPGLAMPVVSLSVMSLAALLVVAETERGRA